MNQQPKITGPFLDDRLNKAFHKFGCCKAALLEKDEIAIFRKRSEALVAKLEPEYRKGFHSLSHHNGATLRNESIEMIAEYYQPALEKIIHPDFEVLPGVHLIKSQGLRSRLGYHQDSALVDERNSFSLQAWMPLQDTNWKNGTIYVIPGSSSYVNPQRGPTVPNMLLESIRRVDKYGLPVNMKAGEVLFFNSRMIHGSSRNFRKQRRLAVNAIIKPRKEPIVYYFYDKRSNTENVEMYRITDEFYANEDIYSRPVSNAQLIQTEKLARPSANPHIMKMAKQELKKALNRRGN